MKLSLVLLLLRERQGFKVDMLVMDYNLGVWSSGERFKLKTSSAFRIKGKPWMRLRFPGKGFVPDRIRHSTENNPQTLAFVVRGSSHFVNNITEILRFLNKSKLW